MAIRINEKIRDEYQKYKELVKGYKDSSLKVIELSEKRKNHPNTRQRVVEVTHEKQIEEIYLIVESKVEDKRSFKFKLRATNFTREPYFRFDSDGVAHYNKSDAIPLSEQKIDTPHFNAFDENGKSIAYKTEALKSKGNSEAILNDISLGMAHYCDESNLYFGKQHIEIVQTPSGELDLGLDNLTPLDGVDYE
jgi:hypothetical protein